MRCIYCPKFKPNTIRSSFSKRVRKSSYTRERKYFAKSARESLFKRARIRFVKRAHESVSNRRIQKELQNRSNRNSKFLKSTVI